MKKPFHGGNPPAETLIDFSSNLHPSPPPQNLLDAAMAGVLGSTQYPESTAESLRKAFSDRLNLSEEQILVGPGSSSLLYHILSVLKPKIVLIPTPCFSEYPYAARVMGAKILEHPVDMSIEHFGDIARPPKLEPGTCVLLSNPCNPTGKTVAREILERWIREVNAAEGWMIVDEAYLDFCETEPLDLAGAFSSSKCLIILRSPLKFFTLPGLRSGLALISSDVLARRLESTIHPWPVSTPAIQATEAIFKLDPIEIHNRRRRIRNWAETFQKEMRTVPDISVYPTDVHYFLVRLSAKGPNGVELSAELASHNIWIRTSAGMPGLTDRDIRLSTRLPEENGRLIQTLKSILKTGVGFA